MACASQSSYLSLMVFACSTEQNSKLGDLKLKKLLEAQPQVANSLSSASQKAATDISEQKVSLANLAAALAASPWRAAVSSASSNSRAYETVLEL